VIILPHNS